MNDHNHIDAAVRDNREMNRLEIGVGEELAFLDYERTPTEFVILHTEVPVQHRSAGAGSRLAKAAVATARAENLRLKVLCPFVREYLKKHPAS